MSEDFDPKTMCCKCMAPIWPWGQMLGGPGIYCRRHHEQAGYTSAAFVDPDKLVAFFESCGGELYIPDAAASAELVLTRTKP